MDETEKRIEAKLKEILARNQITGKDMLEFELKVFILTEVLTATLTVTKEALQLR